MFNEDKTYRKLVGIKNTIDNGEKIDTFFGKWWILMGGKHIPIIKNIIHKQDKGKPIVTV